MFDSIIFLEYIITDRFAPIKGWRVVGVKIQLVDPYDRPKANNHLRVKWTSGGYSQGNTDSNGVYDTGVNSGTIEFVDWYGEVILGRRRVYGGELITVSTSR